MIDQFYLQDSRSYLGNDIIWWATGGTGYTTDLRKAHVFTREEAQQYHNSRETDVPWPRAYIDARTRPAVDVQYCDKQIAHKDSGIALRKPVKPKVERVKCYHCGIFLRPRDQYGLCPKCGGDNCP